MGRLTWVLLGLFLFAVANSDVLASSSDNVGPSESQCRPYIEKAIHNLKTGDKDEDMQSDQPADSVEDKKKDIDLDGDGIPNEQDSDIDGDATLNEDDEDIDGDGILNIDDEDIDGDVIPNEKDSDMDGDGVPNVHDHDIDGDGVPNVADTDLDGDGVPNDRDHDVDGDGVKNADDNDLDGDGIPNDEDDDMDGDGIPNDQDDDMDGDGIPNTQDDDMDGDGIPNSEDDDLDGDGIPNNQDDDIDGDGLPNGQDNDMDGDGVSNERDNDIDGDGVLNIHDQDIDGDGIPNDKDDDIDGDSIPNTEDNDIDGDGVSNVGDHDIDGDGISNHEDTDIDGDGVPNDKDHDVDGDGMPNEEEPASLDIDGDGIPNDDDVDIDGDSKLNEVDEDMDGDGILNIHDRDVDGDGVPNVHDEDSQEMLAQTSAPKGANEDKKESKKRAKRDIVVESAPIEAIDEGSSTGGNGDIDGDGIPDEHDDDIDGDGVPNHKDEDIDGDGVPNNKDSDVDGDGIPNEHDEDNGDKVVDEEIVEVSTPSEQKVEETVVEPADVIPEVVPTPVVETEVPESKEPEVPESKEAEVPEPKEAEVPESKEAEVLETKEAEVTEIKEAEIQPEDELLWEGEVPVNRRNREHITELLQLNDEFNAREKAVDNVAEIILKDIKRIYENAIKPLETQYKYRDLSNRHFGDPEIFSKPLILFMGPWSGGKSTILNYLTDNEYKTTSLRSGAEPSPAYFNILMWGNKTEVLDGTQLAADYTFSGLQKFGQGLEERLRGMKMPSKLLEKVNIVEIPGILEVRKQVSRVFPFNDACQWFIDRADIIFLVYDPAKLDVGPETEAILDQLKGREYQTRIILNKADTVKPEELLRVQSALIWNISPLMSSAQPPSVYTTSLWSNPYKEGAPARLLMAQERAFLRDLREAIEKRVEHKIGSARRFAVRVRNHAKMVDCYLNTYYNHKTLFSNKKSIADQIIENPQNYHIYEGLSTLTNISRYDLPDPEVYRDFFRLNPLYEFKKLSETCTYFRGCPITKLDIAIAYDLPELANKYKKMVEAALNQPEPKELAGAADGQAEKTQKTKS